MPRGAPRSQAFTWVRAAAAALGILAGVAPAMTVADAASALHLVFSEVATGGESASDEFIELYNPAPVPLPLAGLEVAYVTASGATISQRAAWPADAPPVAAGQHVLLANEVGVHAPIADVLYRAGISDVGGTLILRASGAATAIDALGWGTAVGPWPEGAPAPAPGAGFSLHRMRDTNDNASDFEVRLPTPQGSASPAASPAVTPTPTPAASVGPAPTSEPQPSASPGPIPISIAAARGLPTGSSVTVEGLALTGSGFHDGGGYLHDESGGVAVIVEDGAFAAGTRLLVTGTVDDRFSQRTIRTRADDVRLLGGDQTVEAAAATTGLLGEALEGRLVSVSAVVRSGPAALATGLAFDIDDGTGTARVVVGSSTGIDTETWDAGVRVDMIGVLGQRDSSGTGASGYRLQPRSPADVLLITPPGTSPSALPSATSATSAPTATRTPQPAAPVSIRDARDAAIGTPVTVRGIVTMPSGILDTETAVIQDSTAAIVIRLGGDAGALRHGDHVQAQGTRSTKGGMETLRVTSAPAVLADEGAIGAASTSLSEVGEPIEAQLVVVRGALSGSARRSSSGTVSFEIADATGTTRVVAPASLGADDSLLVRDASVEVTGVVGQETTSAEPAAGYRIWPRSTADLRVLGTPSEAPRHRSPDGTGRTDDPLDSDPNGGSALDALDSIGVGDIRIGATLVAGAWPELEIGGLLWDGERLVAIAEESAPSFALLGPRAMPLALELSGVRRVGVEATTGLPLVALATEADAVTRGTGPPRVPRTTMPRAGEPAAWTTLVGRVADWRRPSLDVGGSMISLDIRCDRDDAPPTATVSVTGIGIGGEPRVIVPCEGIRAAPTLGQLAGGVPAGPSAPAPSKEPAEAAVAVPPGDSRRVTGAGLLALAALAACSAVVVRRLAGSQPPAGSRVSGEGSSADSPDVPRLTLVRLHPDDRS